MLNIIASRLYQCCAAATLRRIRSITVYHQARRWRRGMLRALRQRSRE